MTALTVYGTSVVSTTWPQASELTNTGGGGSTTTRSTLIGQSTGFGEVTSQTTNNAWPVLNSLPNATGAGFFWDATTLEQQQISSGAWTPTITLATSVGSIIADVYTRVFAYEGGAFVPITAQGAQNGLLLSGQTITTTPTAFTFAATTLPRISFVTGGKLYMDIWLNITTNSTGNNAATVALTEASSNGVTGCQWVTPGYQALTSLQLSTLYRYGNFILNDGVNYLFQQKNDDLPEYKQTLLPVQRSPLVKKTGERVNERVISAHVTIIGNGRSDVRMKHDALKQALNLRQQNLYLSEIDSRYWVADVTKAPGVYAPGQIAVMKVPITFVAQNPYAYASTSQTFSTGNVTYSLVSGQVYQATFNFAGGGDVPALPVITITNNSPQLLVTLTSQITNGTTGITSIAVTATNKALSNGETIYLGDSQNQTLTVSGTTAQGATSIPVTSFTASNTYPIGAHVSQTINCISAISIQQTTDTTTLSFNAFNLFTGGSFTVTCDPTVTNGETITWAAPVFLNSIGYNWSGTGGPLNYSGTFPVVEPGKTSWTIQLTMANSSTTAQATVQWTWFQRYA